MRVLQAIATGDKIMAEKCKNDGKWHKMTIRGKYERKGIGKQPETMNSGER